jgi:DNA polymerase III alpha subunit
MHALICSGALNSNIPRQEMLFQYNTWCQLTKKEQGWLVDNYDNDVGYDSNLVALSNSERKNGGIATNRRRAVVNGLVTQLHSPSQPLNDPPSWIIKTEEEILGLPLTISRLDKCDLSNITHFCQEFEEKEGKMRFGVEILRVTEHTTSKGDDMAFLTVRDNTGILDSVLVWPETYKKYKRLLYTNNTIVLIGKKDKDTFITDNIKVL